MSEYGTRGRRRRGVRLFGFELTMTSALLLFIAGVGLIFTALYGLYQCIMIVINLGETPVVYFFIYAIILAFGTYIFIQTIRFRTKTV